MKPVKKVLKVRKYKAGYEIRDELVDGSEFGGEDFTMKTAYTPSGDYIGNPKFAYRMCKKRGIAPEKISNDSNVCSIGFCEKEQKFYGWSHRAIFGFGIGSKTKKGDCGFRHDNVLDLFGSLSKDEREKVVNVDSQGLTLKEKTYNYKAVPMSDEEDAPEKMVAVGEAEPHYWAIVVGRGEWIAETLDDAKQMAIDFAKSIS